MQAQGETPTTHDPSRADISRGFFSPYRRVAQSLTGRLLSDEYLDQSTCAGVELTRELDYLRAINRALRGSRLSQSALDFVKSHTRVDSLSLLDVGTGSGDIARALALSHPEHIRVVAVDRRAEMIEAARANAPAIPNLHFETGDIFALEQQFAAHSFDVVHASLTLHHFPDEAVIAALRAMAGVARHAVIWNDLKRGAIPTAAVRVATMFAMGSTKHDARVSVEAGFTPADIELLAQRAGLRVLWMRGALFYRFVAVLVRR